MNNQNNQYPLGGYNYNQYQQQGMAVENQQCMSNKKKPIMDIVALVTGILSLLTCSGCFVLGITGLVLSIIVLVDNSGKYVKKTKAIVAMVLSIISILMLIVAMTFGSFTDTTVDESKPMESSSQTNEEDTEHISVGGITGFSNDSNSEVSGRYGETEIIEENTETNEDADKTSDTVGEIRDNDTIDEQQNNTVNIDENGYYHLSKEQIGKEYLNRKICIYGKITDELYGDRYSYPYIEVNGINCYVENMDFNEFMSANDISGTNDEDVYATVYGTLENYSLFGGLIRNIDCIVLDNDNYYGDISLYNKDEASKIINITAEELLKLSENQNYVSINGATEEIYNTYNNKKCTVTGTVRDIQGNSIFIDSDDNGYNYVNANTTTVVYYVTDDISKYSIGDYVEVTGTLKCYRYAIQIIEK